MKFFNKLTPPELERLALLLEELGEAEQAIGKILRHGYSTYHPDGGPDNRRVLEKELGDVQHAISLLCTSKDLRRRNIDDEEIRKSKSVKRYLHHQDI